MTKITVLLPLLSCHQRSARLSPDGVSAASAGKFVKSQALPRILLAIATLASLSIGRAEENAVPAGDYVSRAEYDKLKSEHEAMKQEVEALKATVKQLTENAAKAPAPPKPAGEGKQVAGAPSEAARVVVLGRSWRALQDGAVQDGAAADLRAAAMLAVSTGQTGFSRWRSPRGR